MKTGLFCLCSAFLFGYTHAAPKPSNATVQSITYANGESNYVFTDTSGDLSDVISTYEFEIIVNRLGFGEGPKWIQDCSYVNNGYMLIGDQYSDCLWRYWASDSDTYELECIRTFDDGEKPNGVGWNLNYPDEIFVALQGSHNIVRLNLTADGWPELNRWNVSADGEKLWYCNDVIEDSQGNAYFTTYPFDIGNSSGVTTGAWMISRDTWEVTLIEELNWGTNGIAMNLDETLLVVANPMDYARPTFNGGDSSQVDYDNNYWRGYTNEGSMSTTNDFNSDNAFDYLNLGNIEDYISATALSDGSAFDFDGNYWQSIIHGDTAEGFILIVNTDDGRIMNDSAIIGVVNFTGTGYGPTNVAKGMDGYMYVTLTQWSGDCSNGGTYGWGCGGVLGRIPLTTYYTSDGSNDYVLDCSNSSSSSEDMSTTDSSSGDDDDDDDSAYSMATFSVMSFMVIGAIFEIN